MRSFLRMTTVALAACALSGCGTSAARVAAEAPALVVRTQAEAQLQDLPAPKQKLDVAVFAFSDQTGQHKPNDYYADYSFAVTQGGANILMDALQEAGRGKWYTVLERNRLGDLFQERQIIRANRMAAPGPNGKPLPPLGPLLNAGVIFEGGIVGYDTNVLTGGVGANFLGIGGDTQYRKDSVAVYLRAVSVLTGQILVSIDTTKTIYSVALNGGVNRYVGFNKLLQLEAGVTTNEPVELAVRQAIEKAVYAVTLAGAQRGYWEFADPKAAAPLIRQYIATRDGTFPASASTGGPPGEQVQPAGGVRGGDVTTNGRDGNNA